MANLTETLKIEKLGPYGFLSNGSWYGLDEKSGLKPTDFKAGETYTVLLYRSKSGKPYVTKIMNGVEPASTFKTQALAQVLSNFLPTTTTTVTTTDVVTDAFKTTTNNNDPAVLKQERILRQGVFQAVAGSPSVTPFILKKEDFTDVVSELAEEIIKKIKGE